METKLKKQFELKLQKSLKQDSRNFERHLKISRYITEETKFQKPRSKFIKLKSTQSQKSYRILRLKY